MSDKPRVFISHSSKDKPFVRRLADDLEAADISVWMDERDLDVGGSIVEGISEGLKDAAYLIVVLSPNSVESKWVQAELSSALMDQLSEGGTIVLPALIKDCEIPPLLRHRVYADFRESYPDGLKALLVALKDESGGVSTLLTAASSSPDEYSELSLAKLLVSPTKLRHAAAKLFGRDESLRLLDAAWEKTQTNILVIAAWGGTGKTALVTEWMAQMAADTEVPWRGAQRVFDWSFYSQGTRTEGEAGSADIFIAAALRFFGDPDPQAGSPHDRGERLARLINGSRHLLVLDGLEPLQHPPGPVSGYLTDPAITALLNGLAHHNTGLCIVTTREPVADLTPFLEKTVEQWPLDHLSDPVGAELLYSLGVTRAGEAKVKPDDKELLAAVREVEGHALTLTLMGKYLKLAFDGDVRQRDVFRFDEADAQWITNPDDPDSPYGHAFKVISAYERWFGDDDGKRSADEQTWCRRQLAVLRLMGLFVRPADAGCLAALRQEPGITGLTDSLVGIRDRDWKITVARLEEVGLLRRDPPTGDTFALDSHPLIREYFAQRLQDDQQEAWRAGHKRLFEHLTTTTKEGDQPTLEQLQPLYQAVTHGCLAGLRQKACDDVYRDRILKGARYGGYYSTKKLGAFGADLGAVACFFDEPWSRVSPNLSRSDRAWLLNEAGYRLRALGRLREALGPMLATLKINVDNEKWNNAAAVGNNLSELSLTLGDVAEAVDAADESIDYAGRSGDAFLRMALRTALADALHQFGRTDDAHVQFAEAESIQEESQPEYPRLYSVQGFQYCDLLLAASEQGAWRGLLPKAVLRDAGDPAPSLNDIEHRAKQTLGWILSAAQDILSPSLDRLTLARIALYRSRAGAAPLRDPNDPESDIVRAVDGLRKAGQQHYLPLGLLTLAWYLAELEDEPGAREVLEEAEAIAVRGPMPLHLADIHLHRARLFGDLDELAKARTLIEKHGYNRRLGELEDAEAAMGG